MFNVQFSDSVGGAIVNSGSVIDSFDKESGNTKNIVHSRLMWKLNILPINRFAFRRRF